MKYLYFQISSENFYRRKKKQEGIIFVVIANLRSIFWKTHLK